MREEDGADGLDDGQNEDMEEDMEGIIRCIGVYDDALATSDVDGGRCSDDVRRAGGFTFAFTCDLLGLLVAGRAAMRLATTTRRWKRRRVGRQLWIAAEWKAGRRRRIAKWAAAPGAVQARGCRPTPPVMPFAPGALEAQGWANRRQREVSMSKNYESRLPLRR